MAGRPARWCTRSIKCCSWLFSPFLKGTRHSPTSPALAKKTVPAAPLLPIQRRHAAARPGRDIFAALDAKQFQRCFVACVASVTGMPADVIAIAGKNVRRSGGKKHGHAPIRMVSALAARQRLVLGQVKVAESNEIIAIPKLLRMLAIAGAIVTIDAIGCQRDIARAIIDTKADVVLALKVSQGTLREDVDVSSPNRKSAALPIQRSQGIPPSTLTMAVSKPGARP